MSYIRATSCPEQVYMVGDAPGHVTVYEGQCTPLRIPRHVFEGLFRRWADRGAENMKYRGASVTTTPDFRYALYYKDWSRSIVLWEVTTNHIAANVERRHG